MAGPEQDDEDKPHEATPKKLQDARRKGDVARSQDVAGALSFGALCAAIAFLGPGAVDRLGGLGVTLLTAGEIAVTFEADGTAGFYGTAALTEATMALLPVLMLPVLAVLAGALAQRQVVFAPDRVAPKLSRLSLIANAQQKFGRRGLFEFLKSFAKLVFVSAVLALFGLRLMGDIAGSMSLAPRQAIVFMSSVAMDFLWAVLLLTAGIAVVDHLFQVSEWHRRNRMSHRELRDELKETEGDPQLKQERRRKAHELVSGPVAEAVRSADVLIVNPQHYAVALRWDRMRDSAPVCTAKGRDEVALRMREIAEEAGVAIRSDPPTARALHATMNVGDEVEPEHYGPVAAAIRFADGLRRQRAARGF